MTPTGVEEAKETVEDAGEDVAEGATEKVSDGGGDSLAKRILIPAAAGIGTLAATMAARKAPDLFRNRVMPKLEQKGGDAAANAGKQAASRLTGEGGVLGTVAGKAAEKLGGGGGGKKKTRRLPIQRWTDVAVPVDVAYDRWTRFEDFPKFMHRVLSVQEKDDDHVTWQEKIWFSKRQWEGEITQQEENDRIAWKTVSGTSHSGLVSFHALDDRLTRVMVTLDFQPSGIIEKMGSGLRFAKRAVQADLARFKAYVEMDEAEGLEYSPEGEQKSARGKGGGKEDDEESSRENGAGDTQEVRQRTSDETEQARKERAQRREQRH